MSGSTHVIQIPTKRKGDPAAFPAWKREGGMVVDLRLFPKDGPATQDQLVFRRDVLERDGINPAILEVASHSSPPGWAFLTDDNVWQAVEVSVAGERDFYVTVQDGERTGYLLGPYATHHEAKINVERGKKLAEKHNTRALFGGYAYGTASAPHGTEIPTVFGK